LPALIGQAAKIKNSLLISETNGLNDSHFKNRSTGYHLHHKGSMAFDGSQKAFCCIITKTL
jgi:hypothetical protein